MGVIKRQSIKMSIVSYLGTAIAAFSTLFIYPLDKEIYGYALFLVSTATFLYPFASLGVNTLTVRYFTVFKNESQNHHGFLGLLLLAALLSCGVFVLLLLAFQSPAEQLMQRLSMNAGLVFENVGYIIVLLLLVTIMSILTNHSSNFMRVVIPSALTNNLWFKIALPAAVLLFVYGGLSEAAFAWSVVGYYAVGVLALAYYLHTLGGLNLKPDFRFVDGKLLRKMADFALYGMLGMIGSVLAFRIDLFMVPTMLDLNSNGIYGIALFIGNSIEMPTRALSNIASPVIAQAWKDNKREEIRMIYTKASLNLTIAGTLLFLLIWVSLDDLLQLTRDYEQLKQGTTVVLLVGAAKLIDMVTSVNGQIIGHSRYYRFNFYTILVLGAANIYLNYLLIPLFGITGAAMATFCSLALFNLSRLLFILFKFRMHPFSWQLLGLAGIAAATYAIVTFLPLPDMQPLVAIVVKSSLIALLFLPPVLYFHLSEDINELTRSAWDKVRSFLP